MRFISSTGFKDYCLPDIAVAFHRRNRTATCRDLVWSVLITLLVLVISLFLASCNDQKPAVTSQEETTDRSESVGELHETPDLDTSQLGTSNATSAATDNAAQATGEAVGDGSAATHAEAEAVDPAAAIQLPGLALRNVIGIGPGDITSLSVTPSTDVIVATYERHVELRDVGSGHFLGMPIVSWKKIARTIVSPDGKKVAVDLGENSVRDHVVAIIDVSTLKCDEITIQQEGIYYLIGFSDDSESIIGIGAPSSLFAFSLRSQEKQWEIELTGFCGLIISTSHDGRFIASTCGENTIRIYDTHNGELLAVLRGHTGEVETLTFSEDGSLLVSSAEDGSLRIWSTSNLADPVVIWFPRPTIGEEFDTASWVSVSAEEGVVAAELHTRRSRISELFLWDPQGNLLHRRATVPGTAGTICSGKSFAWIAAADGALYQWRWNEPVEDFQYENTSHVEAASESIDSIAFTEQGDMYYRSESGIIACIARDSLLHTRYPTYWSSRLEWVHDSSDEDACSGCPVSPDGRFVLGQYSDTNGIMSVYVDGSAADLSFLPITIRNDTRRPMIWYEYTQELLDSREPNLHSLWTGGGPHEGMTASAFSLDGSLLAVAIGRLIQVYETGNWSLQASWEASNNPDIVVTALAISPNAKYVLIGTTKVSARGHAGTASLWELKTAASTKAPVQTLGDSGLAVKSAEFSFDGRFVAISAAHDASAAAFSGVNHKTYVWDLLTDKQVLIHKSRSSHIEYIGGYSGAFTSDGTHFVSISLDSSNGYVVSARGPALEVWSCSDWTREASVVLPMDRRIGQLDTWVPVVACGPDGYIAIAMGTAIYIYEYTE